MISGKDIFKKLVSYKVTEQICCPVCNNICNDNVLSEYTAEETAAYFCTPSRNKDRYQRLLSSIRLLWKQDTSLLVKCKACSFAFGFPYVGGDEAFYSILHEQYGYPGWRADYDLAIKKVLSLHQGGQILDIGAGTGNFLSALKKTWETYAVEGSDITRDVLQKANINTYPSLEKLIEERENTFTVVTMFQVLEHISTFNEILENCRRLLHKGGHIFISVPDGDDMILQEVLLGCPDYPPNHINKWTAASLTIALEKHGFKVIESSKTPDGLNELKFALHVSVMGNATKNKKSLAAKVYTIKNKRVRAPLLALLGVIEAIKLLPHVKQLYKGRTFILYAEAI